MAFDPYNFYLDGKRKEQRWASVTPFILVGLLLLIMAIDGYLSYRAYVAPVGPAVIPYTKLTPTPVRLVAIKTCGGEWADLFMDEGMTIRLPNPLLSESDGMVRFFSPSKCVKMTPEKP